MPGLVHTISYDSRAFSVKSPANYNIISRILLMTKNLFLQMQFLSLQMQFWGSTRIPLKKL